MESANKKMGFHHQKTGTSQVGELLVPGEAIAWGELGSALRFKSGLADIPFWSQMVIQMVFNDTPEASFSGYSIVNG